MEAGHLAPLAEYLGAKRNQNISCLRKNQYLLQIFITDKAATVTRSGMIAKVLARLVFAPVGCGVAQWFTTASPAKSVSDRSGDACPVLRGSP